jgi:hypothetical protein
MAAAVAALGFGASPRLSAIFFLEQAIETIIVFGRTGFIAPGGTMNVYLGGAIGFLWVAGMGRRALQRIDSDQPEDKQASS